MLRVRLNVSLRSNVSYFALNLREEYELELVSRDEGEKRERLFRAVCRSPIEPVVGDRRHT